MADCFEQIKKLIGDKLSDTELRDIIKRVESIKDSPNFPRKAKLFRERTIEQIEFQTELKARELAKRNDIKQFMTQEAFTKADKNAPFTALTAGVDFLTKGGNLSFDRLKQVFSGKHLNNLQRALGDNTDAFTSGKLDVELAQAIDNLNNGKSVQNFRQEVRQAAIGVRAMNTAMVRDLQEAGVIITQRNDFIARQSHNREKILDLGEGVEGFDKWFDEIHPKLDVDKTFDGIESTSEQKKILRGIYDDITSGEFENTIGHFGGKRAIHFKSGTDWADYNAKFGNGSIIDTITQTVNSASKHAASSRVFGPNPERTWAFMEREIEKTLSGDELANFKDTRRLTGAKSQRDVLFKTMFNLDRHPGKGLTSKTLKTVLTLQAAAKLGQVLPTTLTDVAFSAMNFKAAAGKGAIGANFDAVSSFFSVLKGDDLQYWANATDMYFGDLVADSFERFGSFADVGRGGAVETFSRKVATLTGLEAQSSRAKVANARLFSMELGRNKNVKFNELNPRLRASLERFDISDAEWDVMRSATEEYRGGVEGITPEAIRNLPDIPKGIKRSDLENKVATFLSDNAKVGSPDASLREKAIITQGLSPDDTVGAFLRLAGQFKSFSLAVPRVLRRISLSNPDKNATKIFNGLKAEGDLDMLALTMSEATMLAGVALMAKDVLKGKTPRDMTDPKNIAEAFANGALPLMGSYIFDALRGEYDQFGRSMLKDLAGPTFSQIDDFAQLAGVMIKDPKKGGSKLFKQIQKNTPGANLWFVQPIIEKAFLADMHEMLNPGYQRRMQQRVKREGQDFLYNPF